MKKKRVLWIVLGAWLLAACLKTAPVTPATAPVMQPDAAAGTPAGPEAANTEAAAPNGTPLPDPTAVGSSPLFPGLDLALEAALDAQTRAGRVYIVSLDPAFGSEGGTQSFAGQLGIEGPVFHGPGYMVLDGAKRFHTSTADPVFELAYSPPALLPAPDCTAPCLAGEAAGKLENFLKERGLLNFEYRINPSPNVPRQVEIFKLLDGAPFISPYGPAMTALTDKNGELLWLRGNSVGLDAGEERKLRSAGEAWQALKDGTAGVIFQEYPSGFKEARTWARRYTLGENLVVYGEAQSYKTGETADETPLILLNGYIVTGATQGLAAAAGSGRIIEAWGRANEDGPNGPEIELTSWQASVFPAETIEGRLERTSRDAYLVTEKTRYFLPGTPDDIAEGTRLTARGIMPIAEIPTIEWWSLTEGPIQSVRTGGPGFHPVSLDAQTALQPTPITGQVDGAAGIPQVIVHSYADGSSQVEVQFIFTNGDGSRLPTTARLDGPGLQGIEAYHNLPVRIWGQAAETDGGLTAVEVERFEPAYPDLRVGAWLGMAEKAEAEGKPVWLVTTPDGESFVLGSTLNGAPPAAEPALLRDPIIVEGLQIPGKTLLDFTIIDDLRIVPGVGRNDMEGYQPESAQPRVVHEPGAAGARRLARINSVERVYVLTTPAGQLAERVDRSALAQPAWRFSGRFEDGAYFEIYVQALFEV